MKSPNSLTALLALAVACLMSAGAAYAQPEPPGRHAATTQHQAAAAVQPGAYAEPLYAHSDGSCDAKTPAPMKGGGGKKPPKKCVTANVPLDDGYVLAKFKKGGGKAAKSKKPPKT